MGDSPAVLAESTCELIETLMEMEALIGSKRYYAIEFIDDMVELFVEDSRLSEEEGLRVADKIVYQIQFYC